MSSMMTRTAVDLGFVIGSHLARSMGSPRSLIRWIVMAGRLKRYERVPNM